MGHRRRPRAGAGADRQRQGSANVEVAWADAQQFMAVALAGAEQAWTTALADAQLLLAQAQGALVAAMGSSFGYSPSMPTLGSVPGIDSYAVPAAGETRYFVNVSFVSRGFHVQEAWALSSEKTECSDCPQALARQGGGQRSGR